METLFQDLRFALRQILKSPGFAVVAIVTLSLGIGANTAIFSVVNGVLLRPLGFRDPARLVRVWHVPPAQSFPGIDRFSVSPANYIDWEKQNHVFEQTAIYCYRGFTLTSLAKPLQVDASAVSSQFFQVLGVQPLLGRTLLPEEDDPGRSNVVVLSYRFWQEKFGGNREIVGHDITIDGRNFQVAGVMPPTFRFPDYAQMWTPMAWTDTDRAVRGEHHYVVVARLKPNVDVKAAQAEMNTISARLAQLYPADDKGWGAVVVPLHQDLVSDVRPAMLVLLGAVACVLLIACVNVANLILARAFGRQKEIAIRTALGASSGRVLRQVLTESVFLSLIGGALGLAFAPLGIRLIIAYLADKVPPSVQVGLDLDVLLFTAVISFLTGILSGLVPGLRLSRKNVSQTLKEGLGRTDTDTSGHSTRSVLVVAEVSLSLVLLMAAGLMIRSFQRLHNEKAGFEASGVLTANVAISGKRFENSSQEITFFEQVLQHVRALPGVQSAGVVDDIPLTGGSHQPIAIDGRPVVAMSEQPEVDVRLISPGYMQTLRIPILRGRDINEADSANRPAVILISQSMAQQFWPGEDAVGKRLTLSFFPGVSREVVGVVGDVKMDGLDQTRPSASLYWPLAQISPAAMGGWRSFGMMLVVRTANNPAGLASSVDNAVHRVDPETPLKDILPMPDVVAGSISQQRFSTVLLGTFAALALTLAAIGIYSVLSYSVKRRVNEIGIRMALGARLGDVLRMIVFEGMKLVAFGVAIGVVAALTLGRVMSSMIYQVKPSDPLTFVVVAGLLGLVAFLASVIPAYRAARVDPMKALHYE
ncbi:MAG TPA: ABC transporter permease [Candidatus Sulfotelmatobacter sp.]|nr:ABC transporter permease [Candidatus Sulfotelmatobacter sp.]